MLTIEAYMDTRRTILKGMSLAALTASVTASGSAPVYASSTAQTDLLQPGPLGDIWLGSPTAKVTIIEYVSLTCHHCADFHRETWPPLKKLYVDTGKVRFAVREFPLDPIATAAAMMARCDGGAQYYQVIDLLLDQQADWAFVKKPNSPIEAMAQTLQSIGFTRAKFDTCLRDADTYVVINTTKNRGSDLFKVETTPTLFINSDLYVGIMTINYIEKILSNFL